jgi:transcriptional regulator with XRE-family HTH domain
MALSIQKLIKSKMAEQNLSLDILEERTSISKDMLIRIEQGTFFPFAIQLKALMDVLGFCWVDIIEDQEGENVFVALMESAQTDSERIGFSQMISKIVCLRKHDRLRCRANDK